MQVYDDGTERLGCSTIAERGETNCSWTVICLQPVRWVSAIWRVLEANQTGRRANESRSLRGRSRPSSMLSSGEGSANTHYEPRLSRFSPLASSLPVASLGHTPSMTTDDQVITTSAGLAAPIIQRGSRRLAAAGLARTRSLRRVASEADLSEFSVPSDGNPGSESDVANIPLTVDAARARGTSRDFTFAGGISPPHLSSPPPGYTSPLSETAFGTAYSNIGSTYRTAHEPTTSIAGATAPTLPLSRGSFYTAQPLTPMGTVRQQFPSPLPMTQPSTPVTDSLPVSSTATFKSALRFTPEGSGPAGSSRQEAITAAPSIRTDTHEVLTPSERTAMPTFAITRPSPGGSADSSSTADTFTTARPATVYGTARGSIYSSALGSPFETASERATRLSSEHQSGSVTSYDTAPPPVPSHDSRYSTASLAPSSPMSETLTRYQLHDDPVPSSYRTAVYGGSSDEHKEDTRRVEGTWRFVSDRMSIANASVSKTATAYQTAPPGSVSSYSTAPPPPISRGDSPRSQKSDVQELDSVTHVSEMTDLGLLADLERRSSSGSDAPAPLRRAAPAVTTYGTAREVTVYETARESAYVTAPSWRTQSTYMTTAQGTQELVYTSCQYRANRQVIRDSSKYDE